MALDEGGSPIVKCRGTVDTRNDELTDTRRTISSGKNSTSSRYYSSPIRAKRCHIKNHHPSNNKSLWLRGVPASKVPRLLSYRVSFRPIGVLPR